MGNVECGVLKSNDRLEGRLGAYAHILVCYEAIVRFLQILYMAYQVVVTRNILHLLASRLAQQAERLLLVDARKPATAKVGGNARWSCR